LHPAGHGKTHMVKKRLKAGLKLPGIQEAERKFKLL